MIFNAILTVNALTTTYGARMKVGDLTPSGATVESILGDSTRVTVFTTSDQQLRWSYRDANGNDADVPVEYSPAVAKFNFLMETIRAIVPKKHKRPCYILLGKALFSAFSVSSDKAMDCLVDVEKYVHQLTLSHARAIYVVWCMGLTALVSICMTALLHGTSVKHELYFYGALFGLIGACISVTPRARSLDVDWTLDRWALLLQATVRVTLGLLFGAVFVLACRADFLFGAFKMNHVAVFLLSLVAGFSERMIPDLFARLEIAGVDND